jgi:hypothetical protein
LHFHLLSCVSIGPAFQQFRSNYFIGSLNFGAAAGEIFIPFITASFRGLAFIHSFIVLFIDALIQQDQSGDFQRDPDCTPQQQQRRDSDSVILNIWENGELH